MASIELNKICKSFGHVEVLKDIDLNLEKGEFVVFVGPSGCGKSTLLRLIAGLEDISGGDLMIDGERVNNVLPAKRGISMVFQSYALYPHMTVYENMAFGLEQAKLDKTEADKRIREAAEMLQITPYLDRKPRQLSGGQKQRVGIARAFAGGARIVVADEPVSALDVSVQAAVTDLLMEIQREEKTTLLFISHDLSIVRYLSDRVMVMYLGHVVELGSTDEVFAPPYHPYTEALLSAVPIADTKVKKKHIVLEGDIPSAMNPPPGCPFQTRCNWKDQVPGNLCDTEVPPMRQLSAGHQIKCHLSNEALATMEPVIKLPDAAE